jgi:hypothetical protein
MAVLESTGNSSSSSSAADNDRIVQDALSIFEQRPLEDRNSFMCAHSHPPDPRTERERERERERESYYGERGGRLS